MADRWLKLEVTNDGAHWVTIGRLYTAVTNGPSGHIEDRDIVFRAIQLWFRGGSPDGSLSIGAAEGSSITWISNHAIAKVDGDALRISTQQTFQIRLWCRFPLLQTYDPDHTDRLNLSLGSSTGFVVASELLANGAPVQWRWNNKYISIEDWVKQSGENHGKAYPPEFLVGREGSLFDRDGNLAIAALATLAEAVDAQQVHVAVGLTRHPDFPRTYVPYSRLWLEQQLLPLAPYGVLPFVRKGDPHLELYDSVNPLRKDDGPQWDALSHFGVNGEAIGAVRGSPEQQWNERIARPYLDALRTAGVSTAVSAIPTFEKLIEPDATQQRWELRSKVVRSDSSKYSISKSCLTLDEHVSVEARALFEGLRTHDGSPLNRRLRLSRPSSPPEDGICFCVEDVRPAEGDREVHDERDFAQVVRIGALDLHYDRKLEHPALPKGRVHGRIAGGVRIYKGDLRLVAEGFAPVTQDLAPGELPGAPRSLLIPLAGSGLITGVIVVEAHEQSEGGVRQMRLSLERPGDAAAEAQPLDFIALGSAPLLIARVRAPDVDLAAPGQVAAWNHSVTEGARWLVPNTQPGADILFPPQAIGEETLRDYKTKPPAPPSAPFGYRFSPAATLRIFRTRLARNFAEPPWNLRRLLGYPGQSLPGAAISSLEFELLYGLTTRLTPVGKRTLSSEGFRVSDPRADANKDLQLVELEARIGHIPPLPAGDIRADLAGAVDAIASRIAYVEPRRALTDETLVSLTSGISFTLRESRNTAAHEAGGLPGGVDWGFPSKKILAQVETSGPGTGLVEGVAFTSLGGIGYQRAEFLGGVTKIYSNTYLGRTFFYSVERLGRIGVLWNRAKHVVIYERSVVASEQFHDDHAADWDGIPALRKMQEFVEILEGERRYPDEPGANAASAGFVEAAKFPRPIIPVDSAWGRDVPTGWVVPLHNPNAGPFYRQPDVFLRLSASRDRTTPHGRLTEPHRLYFYTSTNEASPDSDAWSAVEDIDFARAKVPVRKQSGSPEPTDAPQADPPAVDVAHAAFTFAVDTGGASINLLGGRQTQAIEAIPENVTLARRNLNDCAHLADGPLENARQGFEDVREKVANLAGAAASLEENAFAALRAHFAGADGPLSTVAAKLRTLGQTSADHFLARQREALNGILGETDTAKARLEALRAAAFSRIVDAREEESSRFTAVARGEVAALFGQLRGFENVATSAILDAENAFAALTADLRELARRIADEQTASGVVQRALASADAGRYRDAVRRLAAAQVDRLMTARQRFTVFPERAAGLFQQLFAKTKELTTALAALDPHDAQSSAAINRMVKKYLEFVDPDAGTAISTFVKAARDDLKKVRDLDEDVRTAVTTAAKTLDGKIDDVCNKILAKEVREADEALRAALETGRTSIRAAVQQLINMDATTQAELARVWGAIESLPVPAMKPELDELLNLVDAVRRLGGLENETKAIVGGAITRLTDVLESAVRPYERIVRDKVRAALPPADVGASTLRLLRAFGGAPIGQSLALNRSRLAYLFHEGEGAVRVLEDAVHFSDASVLVNRLSHQLESLDLKSFSVRMPSFALQPLTGGLIGFAPNVAQLELRKVLPNIAGIDLSELLNGFEIPEEGRGIRITHGVDPTSLSAWALCEIDIKQDGAGKALFQWGPLEVRLSDAEFRAQSRIELHAGSQAPQRVVEGSLEGRFAILLSGQEIVALDKAEIRFDAGGHLGFALHPRGPSPVIVHEALAFITKLLENAMPKQKEGSGLRIELLKNGGVPAGVRALLKLALPPLQSGAFSISNLAIASEFRLELAGGFKIATGFALASRDRPFNLSVLCLGGGGWFEVSSTYAPFDKSLVASLSIGISAGASLPFDIGVASGGVSLLASLGVEWTSGAGGGLDIFIRVVLRGEVSILGIVSVELMLGMEARYTDNAEGRGLVCRGMLHLSIKIGWFFEIGIDTEVSFKLLKGSQKRFNALDAGTSPYETAVAQYVNAFGV